MLDGEGSIKLEIDGDALARFALLTGEIWVGLVGFGDGRETVTVEDRIGS